MPKGRKEPMKREKEGKCKCGARLRQGGEVYVDPDICWNCVIDADLAEIDAAEAQELARTLDYASGAVAALRYGLLHEFSDFGDSAVVEIHMREGAPAGVFVRKIGTDAPKNVRGEIANWELSAAQVEALYEKAIGHCDRWELNPEQMQRLLRACGNSEDECPFQRHVTDGTLTYCVPDTAPTYPPAADAMVDRLVAARLAERNATN